METQQAISLSPLVKMSTTFKMTVPASVEEKIRYLIRKFPATEWSGVLFYKHQGSFENNDLSVTCVDILPMDLGTAGWTEFKMSTDVAGYVADHLELFECETGLIHSHHTLGAFFSGQDLKTLQSEGNDTNCFVSLIVDTKGTYQAAITRKIQTKSEVTVKNIQQSYQFFGDGETKLSSKDKKTAQIVEKESIEYFMFDVEVEQVSNPLDYLDARFEEIEKRKQEEKNKNEVSWLGKAPKNNGTLDYWEDYKEFSNKNYDFKEPVQLPLWNQQALDDMGISDSYSSYIPDPVQVRRAAINMITCSFIVKADSFDLKQWITKSMPIVYKRIFEEQGYSFNEWKSFIVSFLLDSFFCEDSYAAYDDVWNEAAKAIQKVILPYKNSNKYIQEYCKELESYFI